MRCARHLLSLLMAIGLLTTAAMAWAQQRQPSAFQPALTVNDQPITWYDIDQRMRLLAFSGVRGGDDIQQVAVDQLIEDTLKRQAGANMGAVMSDDSADQLIESFAQANSAPVARIEAGLRQTGTNRTTLVEALAADAVWREVIRGRFGSLAEPSEAEVDQAVALAAAGRNTEYLLAEIVIPTARRGEVQTRALAEDLFNQLSAGGDFGTAARRYSASASARQGGDIGWVPEGSLPPPVAEALAETRTGGVTRPLPVQGAVALLKVVDQRRIDVGTTTSASVGLLTIAAQDTDPLTAVARVDDIVAAGPDCTTGEAMALEAGLSVDRAAPRLVSDLPEPIRNAIDGLQIGEVGGPVSVSGGAAAFIICERLDGVPPEVRDRIREQLRQERFQRFANSYLQELRSDAVIERR